MQSRFFTLASSALIFLGAVSVSWAQPIPTPTPKVGYIRLWNMAPPTSGVFEVRKAGTTPSEGALLTGTPYRYSSYQDFPIGRYRLEVLGKGSQSPLKIFDVDLKQDTYFTILVSPRTIDMFDDAEDPKATSAIVTIRNFFPGITVSASIAQKPVISSLAYGQSYQVTGLPLDRATITFHTTLPNGKPAESSADIDFRSGKRATALIIPDSYGRFRPRVTFDGKNL